MSHCKGAAREPPTLGQAIKRPLFMILVALATLPFAFLASCLMNLFIWPCPEPASSWARLKVALLALGSWDYLYVILFTAAPFGLLAYFVMMRLIVGRRRVSYIDWAAGGAVFGLWAQLAWFNFLASEDNRSIFYACHAYRPNFVEGWGQGVAVYSSFHAPSGWRWRHSSGGFRGAWRLPSLAARQQPIAPYARVLSFWSA
jgi:hypothetical protein